MEGRLRGPDHELGPGGLPGGRHRVAAALPRAARRRGHQPPPRQPEGELHESEGDSAPHAAATPRLRLPRRLARRLRARRRRRAARAQRRVGGHRRGAAAPPQRHRDACAPAVDRLLAGPRPGGQLPHAGTPRQRQGLRLGALGAQHRVGALPAVERREAGAHPVLEAVRPGPLPLPVGALPGRGAPLLLPRLDGLRLRAPDRAAEHPPLGDPRDGQRARGLRHGPLRGAPADRRCPRGCRRHGRRRRRQQRQQQQRQ
mmetsp:Transcript_104047/g.294812  ORF Transcript_104047/g.294812 Transcript_104047/m.294812 type:complete len:258 (-) Transcript_104047:2-775(-)